GLVASDHGDGGELFHSGNEANSVRERKLFCLTQRSQRTQRGTDLKTLCPLCEAYPSTPGPRLFTVRPCKSSLATASNRIARRPANPARLLRKLPGRGGF